MNKPETIDDLRAELAALDKQLAEVRVLADRRARIYSLIRRWEALYETAKKKPIKRPVTAIPKASNVASHMTTGDYAAQVLRNYHPMPTAKLVDLMRGAGWVGSGDDATDRKRVYVALWGRGKSTRFKLESGLWRLTESSSTKAATG